ncbi:MAG: phosphatase PAP2 family protein, partial [Burkholderiales bacterium]
MQHIPSSAPIAASQAGATPRPRTWYRQIIPRLGAHMLLKCVGTTAYMSLFFFAYFHLMQNPNSAVTVMPVTAIDELIPFQPLALIPYVTLWLYVALPAALILYRRELIGYGWWIGGLCVAGLVCFYFWPTTVLLPTQEWSKHASFNILQGVDAAANACPSMHVAVAVFSAFWLDRILRDIDAPGTMRALNLMWFVAIAYSTMAIKQHVFIDVVAGLALGAVFALPSLRYRRRA